MNKRFLSSRILTVLLAALFLSFSVPEAVFAEEKTTDIPVAVPKDSAPSFISGPSPVQIPLASDETEQGQIYLAASNGSRTVRSVSPKKPAFLQNGLYLGIVSFAKAETGTEHVSGAFDDLFVIHYIHSQDGEKG